MKLIHDKRGRCGYHAWSSTRRDLACRAEEVAAPWYVFKVSRPLIQNAPIHSIPGPANLAIDYVRILTFTAACTNEDLLYILLPSHASMS